MLTADQFVERNDGPLEQQRKDSHVCRRHGTFSVILRKNQSFAITDDGVKRCNVYSENKFVFAQEIEIAKNLKCVLTVFNV